MSKKGRKGYCVSILKVVIKLVAIFIIRQAPRAAKTMGLSHPRGISPIFHGRTSQTSYSLPGDISDEELKALSGSL